MHRRELNTSQGVPGPHVFAVRFQGSFAYDPKASTASRAQRFVTMAKRPSCRGGTARTIRLILPSEKQKYFRCGGLTRVLESGLSGKSVGHLYKAAGRWSAAMTHHVSRDRRSPQDSRVVGRISVSVIRRLLHIWRNTLALLRHPDRRPSLPSRQAASAIGSRPRAMRPVNRC
jgi:hypothetical protein